MGLASLVYSVVAASSIGWLIGFICYTNSDIVATIDMLKLKTDAVVVLTGGDTRVKAGIDLLREGYGKKLFVSGVHTSVDLTEITYLTDERISHLTQNIVLGYSSEDTSDNAMETAAWMHINGYISLRLVTSVYHMKRSLLEFQRAMPWATIVPHTVPPPLSFGKKWWQTFPETVLLTAVEYTKYTLILMHYQLAHNLFVKR